MIIWTPSCMSILLTVFAKRKKSANLSIARSSIRFSGKIHLLIVVVKKPTFWIVAFKKLLIGLDPMTSSIPWRGVDAKIPS